MCYRHCNKFLHVVKYNNMVCLMEPVFSNVAMYMLNFKVVIITMTTNNYYVITNYANYLILSYYQTILWIHGL